MDIPVSITKKSLVMLLRELIPLSCNIYVKRINTHSVGKMLSFLSLKKVTNTNTSVLEIESNSVITSSK